MKKILSLCLTVLLVISIVPMNFFITADALTSGDYSYSVSNGKATITGCYEYKSGSVTIPSKLGGYTVTGIADCAFFNCSYLTNISIPDSVRSIGECAFYCCESLTSINIPDGVPNISDHAFYGCSSLTSINIPESVTSIGDYAFEYCSSLTSINIPESVTSIGDYAFEYCESLTSIRIPNSVKSIGNGVFWGCDDLTIKCAQGSYALQYASENYIPYKVICKNCSWEEATCTTPKTCKICGETQGDKLGHSYKEATCTEAKICKNCGITNGDPTGHKYSNSCDTSCNVCGETRKVSEHKYSNDCDSTCNECGDKRTTKHTYSNACDTSCNVCKATRSITHSYKITIKPATTSKNGSSVKKCTVCGYIASNVTFKYAKTVTLSNKSYTYNGKVITPTVNVKDSAGKNISSKYYTVSYSSGRKNAGTYKVTIKFKGNYSGTKVLTFKINKLGSSKVTVKASKSELVYNKKVQAPNVTLKDSNGKVLKKNVDYTVKLPSGRKNVGKYTIKYTFKGNYSGTKSYTYQIVPTAKTTIKIVTGGTSSIGAKSNGKIQYSSSKTSVAKVSSKGVITAIKAGKTTITVKSGKITKKIAVTVSNPSVTITGKTTVNRGSKIQLKVNVYPSGKKVTWSVNNKKIATVSSSGVVTGKKYGTVTVTASFKYKGKTYKDTHKVKVKVDTPSISLFASDDYDYSTAFAIGITNYGSKSLKVLKKGYISNSVNYETVDNLYISEHGYVEWFSIKGNSSIIFCFSFNDDVWQNPKTTYGVYFEYDGEMYLATGNTNIYGLNQCTKITHLVD